MEAAAKARAPSRSTGDEDSASVTSTSKAIHAVDDSATAIFVSSGGGGAAANVSEDVLLFGARSSHLFDNIAIAIDSLLIEEVATLPLLPRKLTEQELRLYQQQKDDTAASSKSNREKTPQTGEQKLVAHLRKAYKKNIDAAEAYCNRNIFTVQNHSMTKRRQIMEQFFDTDNIDVDADGGNRGAAESTLTFPLTTTTTALFAPLPDGMELPLPENIMNMDKEILEIRQRIQHAKQRRIRQSRQLGRLEQANQMLVGVLEALQLIENLHDTTSTTATDTATREKNITNDEDIASLMQNLKQSVLDAIEGHEELKIWNTRAEEVLELLDKIKIDQNKTKVGGMNNNAHGLQGNNSGGGGLKVVVEREEDERRRKNTLQEMGASHGSREQVASLLSKLRGN
jgi:hypothetical protein